MRQPLGRRKPREAKRHHAGSVRGLYSERAVLDHGTALGRYSEVAGRVEKQVRLRLPTSNVFCAEDAPLEAGQQPRRAQREPDALVAPT